VLTPDNYLPATWKSASADFTQRSVHRFILLNQHQSLLENEFPLIGWMDGARLNCTTYDHSSYKHSDQVSICSSLVLLRRRRRRPSRSRLHWILLSTRLRRPVHDFRSVLSVLVVVADGTSDFMPWLQRKWNEWLHSTLISFFIYVKASAGGRSYDEAESEPLPDDNVSNPSM
jgi:hypothetical protein